MAGSPPPAPASTGPSTGPSALGRAATSPRSVVREYFGDGQLSESLHILPATYVIVGCALVVGLCTIFLESHLISTSDHLVVFGFGSFFAFCNYYMIYFFLSEHAESFRRISKDKRMYTISNLIKAGVLFALAPFCALHLVRAFMWDDWRTNTLRNMGCIFAIPDFVALFLVRRLGTSTVIHHVCVVLFNFYSIQNDYAQDNFCRLAVIYASFTTFGYIVYILLASRFLGVPPVISRYLSMWALVIYVTCCSVNWVWQATYMRHLLSLGAEHPWQLYVYMALISFVMYDDLMLNQWLWLNLRSVHEVHKRRAAPPLRQRV
jgi:hypothetical protein